MLQQVWGYPRHPRQKLPIGVGHPFDLAANPDFRALKRPIGIGRYRNRVTVCYKFGWITTNKTKKITHCECGTTTTSKRGSPAIFFESYCTSQPCFQTSPRPNLINFYSACYKNVIIKCFKIGTKTPKNLFRC